MSSDLLNQKESDAGRPRLAARTELLARVCVDALGETWAGYVAEGGKRERAVLVTICDQPLLSRPAQRLLKSGRLAQKIRHPNVLALLDLLEEGNQLALVSEYMDGEPLSALLSAAAAQSIQIPEGVALSIMKETIETLSALQHARPKIFLHGGLGPECIFVASFGETMLRHAGLEGVAMQESVFRHSPVALPYRAPEQLRDPRHCTEAADVFSSGVLLWEMLAGRPLFGHKHHRRLSTEKSLREAEIREFEQRSQTMEIPRLAQARRQGGTLHSEVEGLVHCTLNRSPEERPPTLHDLARDIAHLPPELLADSVEIASFVQRVAGRTIAERHRRLNEGAPFSVRKSAPPGQRATARPDARPRAAGERLPSSRPPPPGRGTSPSGPELDAFDAITSTPQHKRQQSVESREGAEAPSLPAPPSLPNLPAIDISPRESLRARERPSGGWLFAALVLVAAGGLGAVLFSHSGDRSGVVSAAAPPEEAEPASTGDSVQEDSSAKAGDSSPKEAEDAGKISKKRVPTEDVKSLDSSNSRTSPISKKPAPKSPQSPRPTTHDSKPKSNAYRPDGI